MSRLLLLLSLALPACQSSSPPLSPLPNPLAGEPTGSFTSEQVRSTVGPAMSLAMAIAPSDRLLRISLLSLRLPATGDVHATLRRYGYMTLNELLPYGEELIKGGVVLGKLNDEASMSEVPVVLPRDQFSFADNLIAIQFAGTPTGEALLREEDPLPATRQELADEESKIAWGEAQFGKPLPWGRAMVAMRRALVMNYAASAGEWDSAFALLGQNPGNLPVLWQVHVLRAVNALAHNDIGPAIDDLRKAVAQIESSRMETRSPEIRARTFAGKLVGYGLLISCLLQTGSIAEAERYVSLAKARSMQDSLVSAEPGTRQRLGTEQRRKLAAAILTTEKDLHRLDKEGSGLADAFTAYEKTAAAWIDYQTLRTDLQLGQRSIRANALQRQTRTIPPFSIPDAGSWVALDYFVTADRIHLWIVGAEGVIGHESKPIAYEQLVESVSRLRRAIVELGDYETEARSLYDLLIAPAEPYIAGRNLIIIPHQILHFLPFEVLRDRGRFLVETHVISYAPALGVAGHSAKNDGEMSFLGLADTHSFQYAAAEVNAARGAFTNGEILVDAAATRDALLQRAAQFGVIHLATHVDLSVRYPLLTLIGLAGGEAFYLFEVPDLMARAKLVVLSGCTTNIGPLDSGDEMTALSRAFLENGVEAVVVSLWKVDDRSTARFMDFFYGKLREEGAAGALAFAKRRMMEGAYDLDPSGEVIDYSHPYYWSGFVALGSSR